MKIKTLKVRHFSYVVLYKLSSPVECSGRCKNNDMTVSALYTKSSMSRDRLTSYYCTWSHGTFWTVYVCYVIQDCQFLFQTLHNSTMSPCIKVLLQCWLVDTITKVCLESAPMLNKCETVKTLMHEPLWLTENFQRGVYMKYQWQYK